MIDVIRPHAPDGMSWQLPAVGERDRATTTRGAAACEPRVRRWRKSRADRWFLP